MVYKCFDKKASGGAIKSMSNEQLAEELYKPIIKKFLERKLYPSFKDNIWGADLGDMQSINKFNKQVRYLLCVIDIISKYAWVIPLKDKNGVTIVNAFQKVLDDSMKLHSKIKPNKIWVVNRQRW